MKEVISFLESHMQDPSLGLPEEIFKFVSRITPMVNVDLLIKDENDRTLLAWRTNCHTGAGWHLPGGIIRYKEKFIDRIKKVAEIEVGAEVEIDPIPLTFNEIITPELTTRGHFVSFLYNCKLSSNFKLNNDNKRINEEGFLMWHEKCPNNLIKVHEIYKEFI